MAKESREENSDVTSIRVHHYNFDGKKLVPCWVIQSELDSYLVGKTKAPKELHAKTQPPGHVAYIGPIEVERITLCGYEVAKLTDQGFLTQMQHASLRYHLRFPASKPCFGVRGGRSRAKQDVCCPLH